MQTSVNVTQQINGLKKKNHTIISIETEKILDKTQHPFVIKDIRVRSFIKNKDAWLTQLGDHAALNLRVMSWSPTLGAVIT